MLNKKYILIIFQIIFILLGCFLSFSLLLTNIIDWYYPDSIVQIDFVKRTNLFGALYANWAYTTLGRPGGVFWIDFWFYISDFFNFNNLYSLLAYRIFSFFTAGLAIVFLIREILKLSFLFSFFVSIFFFNIFLITTGQHNLTFIWELDLSLYVIGIFYLGMVIIFGIRLNRNEFTKINIFAFSFFYFLYLNSSYAHLVSGGILLIIFLVGFKQLQIYLLSPKKIIEEFLFLKSENKILLKKNKLLLCQLLIFLISAIINLTSPSMSLRENVWPSDTDFTDGLLTSLPLLEFFIFQTWGYKYAYITLIIIFLVKYLKIRVDIPNDILISLIILTPFILILTNALAYLSSTLHSGYESAETRFFIFNFENVLNKGHASASRHTTYYNLNAIISYIFLGLFISKNYFKKN